jgi:tripartite-type tricarboxylate transporter receptor subunit TctC
MSGNKAISFATGTPAVLVVKPTLPVSNLKELLAYAKANPGKLTYGSPGTGSTPQLAMENLSRATDVHFIHVPYQGMGPAERDLIAGNIDLMIDIAGNALPFIKDGKMKPIAITTASRISDLPDVPTVGEAVPGFIHAEWFAIVAPPKTPPALAAKISQDFGGSCACRRSHRGCAILPSRRSATPEQTAAFIKAENDRLRQSITLAGLKAK